MIEKILALLGITHDVAENTRETKTDIEDNKPKKRNYSFDDKTTFDKQSNMQNIRKTIPKSKDITLDDDGR